MNSKHTQLSKLFTLLVPIAGLLAATHAFAASEYLMPGIGAFRASAPKAPPAYELAVPTPQVAKELPVIRLARPKVDRALVTATAESLGLKAPPAADHDRSWTVQDESASGSLTLFPQSGGFNYMRTDKLYITPKQAPDLPSRRAAHELALRFLEDLDLLPADALTTFGEARFHNGTLREIDFKSGEVVNTMRTELDVRFNQVWAGFRVSGPGSKLYVSFGDKGEIIGLTRMWRAAESIEAKLEAVQPLDALAALAQGEGLAAFPNGCAKARVTHMEIVYWSRSPKQEQMHSFPVYEVRGECTGARGASLGAFAAYAPAAYDGAIGIEVPPAVPPVDGPPWPQNKR